MNDVEKTIRDYFINLSPENLPISFFIVRKSILRAITELKPKLHGKVLDLACGIMPYKEFLKNESIDEYIGIDLEPTEYHSAVKPDYFWNGKEIPFDNETFDFVIATEFLEHYFDTSHILNEIKRVLKPGGTFFFTVPSLWTIHEAPHDYHRFTPYCLEEHFRRLAFSSWEIKPLGAFHYHFLLSLALWNDFKLSKRNQKVFKPFLKIIMRYLLKKDNRKATFGNNQMYSGLYGFVVK
jgi:SAM-dependent methyltransferase